MASRNVLNSWYCKVAFSSSFSLVPVSCCILSGFSEKLSDPCRGACAESLNLSPMRALLAILAVLTSPFKSRSRLEAENAVLRQQPIVLRRQAGRRIGLTNGDRLLCPAESMVSLDPESQHGH